MDKTVTQRHDDRVLLETRLLSIFIIPFLVIAVATLYVIPDQTDRYFAWTIKASMTSMVLASAYFAGIYFFGRALVARSWHHVKAGFLGITTLATTLGIATALHWDKFHQGSLALILWAGLYATAPFLVFGVWLRNRATDPGTPDADDQLVPVTVRKVTGVLGAVYCVIALIFFVIPDVAIATWPWSLTALTARVISAIFALSGVAALGIARDERWSTSRIVYEGTALPLVLVLIAVARAWNEFNPNAIATYGFIGASAGLLAAIVWIYLVMEARRVKSRQVSEAAPGRSG